jgi:hypothetical protein
MLKEIVSFINIASQFSSNFKDLPLFDLKLLLVLHLLDSVGGGHFRLLNAF